MKNSSFSFVVYYLLLVFFFGPDNQARAEGDNFWMLKSRAACELYMSQRADSVSTYCGTYLPSNGNTGISSKIQGEKSLGNLYKAIASQKHTVEVVNPKDYYYSYARVLDDEGETILFGSKLFYLENLPDGKHRLPDGYGKIILRLESSIKISAPHVVLAQITYLNKEGRSQHSENLTVERGSIYLSDNMLGANAILSTLKDDGRWYGWKIGDGIPTENTVLNLTLSPEIENLYRQTAGDIDVQIPTFRGSGQNKIVQYTSFGYISRAYFYTSEGGWPRGIFIKLVGSDEWTDYRATIIDGSHSPHSLINMPAGTYDIMPDFDEKVLREPEFLENPDGPKG